MLRILKTAVVVASAMVLASCGSSSGGGSSSGDSGGSGKSGTAAVNAQQLFTQSCGGCHTLAKAGTNGTVGPNLDELKPSKETVAAQIKHGGGGMPAGLLEGDEADAVATYVSENAG